MFVTHGAHEALMQRRRASYIAEVLDPALNQARVLGIPARAILDHVTKEMS